MPVSSSTEHWIKPDALTINLNHFGDPDYLQVSVLAGAVVMAFKQGVIGYNAAHNYRTWPLDAANTYLETTSAYNVYARLTRSEVNARALVVYDTVLRDIEGREITYAEDGSEVLGDANPDYFFVFLGQISASVNSGGGSVLREWTKELTTGNLDTNQQRNNTTGLLDLMFRPHYDNPLDPNEITWIEALTHLGVSGGITMFVDGGKLKLPDIYAGLPIDNSTLIRDKNGVLMINPDIELGGASTWDELIGKPTWIGSTKPSYNYSEISQTPDLSVYALAKDLEKYVTLNTEQTIAAHKNFLNGLSVSGLGITKSQDDVIYLDANLVVRGGITMYAEGSVDIPSILDSLPIASTTAKGIASFDSSYFSVDSDGKVTLLAENVGLNEIELFEYLSRNNYAKKSDIPSLSGYATETYVEDRLDELINGAPAAYDTLKEIADVLEGNVDSIGDIITTLGTKADKAIKISAGTGLSGGGTLEADRTLSLATSGVTAGTYKSVTVDKYGRVTSGTNPTTLAGYGITDAYTKVEANALYDKYLLLTGGTLSGDLTLKSSTTSGDTPKIIFQRGTTIDATYDAYIYNAGGGLTFGLSKGGTNYDCIKLALNYLRPITDNSFAFGTTAYRYSNIYSVLGTFSSNVTIGGTLSVASDTTIATNLTLNGIPIYKSQDDVLYIDGNLAVRGGITMYATDAIDVPSIIDALPIASASAKGIAAFNPNDFSVVDGYVSFIGNTGVDESVLANYAKKTDLSAYLPLNGGQMTGNIGYNSSRDTSEYGIPFAGSITSDIVFKSGAFDEKKTFLGGTYYTPENTWYHTISVRHQNGYAEGNTYGLYIVSSYDHSGNLIWNKQYEGRYMNDRVILDSVNWSQFISSVDGGNYLPLTGGIMNVNQGTILSANFASDILGYNPALGTYVGLSSGSTGYYWVYSGCIQHECPTFYHGGKGQYYDILHKGNANTVWGQTFNSNGVIDGALWINAGNYVSNRASLILNSNVNNAADIIFKNGSTITGNYGTWTISARHESDFRFSIWRGGENANGGEAEILSLFASGGLLVAGGITMYSDIRKKTKLQDVELSLKQIADAPLIEHYYNSDAMRTTHVGSIAQYWAGLNDWFCKEDSEGFYTMEIQNAALASAISIARELSRYESKTDKEIRLLKQRVKELEDNMKN